MALSDRLRSLEHMADIPAGLRVSALEQHTTSLGNVVKPRAQCKQAVKRLKKQAQGAKYQIYFGIAPIVTWAFQPPSVVRAVLLDCLLLQLRLLTMMRSVDCANLVWGLYVADGCYYVRTVTKTGENQLFNLDGHCLATLVQYLADHVHHPGLYLFRHLLEPSWCLSSERLAKRVLTRLGELKVDTSTYKSHSLRGAVATHLLHHQVPKPWVQERGGWKSPSTLDHFYNRLHLHQDWHHLLTEGQGVPAAGDRHDSPLCSALKLAYVETTKEVGTKASEEGTAQEGILRAHGILKDLHCGAVCPVCGTIMQLEPTYCCQRCGRLVHVRCLRSDTIPVWFTDTSGIRPSVYSVAHWGREFDPTSLFANVGRGVRECNRWAWWP